MKTTQFWFFKEGKPMKRKIKILLALLMAGMVITGVTACDDATEENDANSTADSETTVQRNTLAAEGDIHEHSWFEATCTEPKLCIDCGVTEGTATEHEYVIYAVEEATCTAMGREIYICANCPASEAKEIAMTAHAFSDATCTVPGTCSVCGTTEGDVSEHVLENRICTLCGYVQASEGLRFSIDRNGTIYNLSGIGECTDTTIIIPSVYEGLPVQGIRQGVFFDCDTLEKVIIPDSVNDIDDFAFAWCDALTSVTLPDGLTLIGEEAFMHCTALTSILIPDSVRVIGFDAFNGCTALKEIFCEAEKASDDQIAKWLGDCSATVYWAGEWEYVDGVPTAK